MSLFNVNQTKIIGMERNAGILGLCLMFVWGIALLGIPIDLSRSSHVVIKAFGYLAGAIVSATMLWMFLYVSSIEQRFKNVTEQLDNEKKRSSFEAERADKAIGALEREIERNEI